MFKLLFLIFFILILLILVAFLVLLERKILRLDQIRKRPNITGFYRVLQTIIDRVKLLLKKYLYSLNIRFFFFFFSPIYGFIISVLS